MNWLDELRFHEERRRREARRRAIVRAVAAWVAIVVGGVLLALAWFGFVVLATVLA